MTKWQASEWVHRQLIVLEVGPDELVAAFTALAERPPDLDDRLKGLFRLCCEIVSSSAPCWDGAGPVAVAHRRKR
jgi:hypothetical protein